MKGGEKKREIRRERKRDEVGKVKRNRIEEGNAYGELKRIMFLGDGELDFGSFRIFIKFQEREGILFSGQP